MAEDTQNIARRAAPAFVVVAFVAVVAHILGTQWFARGLGYNPRWLGDPLFVDEAAGVAFFAPWQVWTWSASWWGGRIDELIAQSMGVAAGGTLIGLGLGALALTLTRGEEDLTAHGSARWARPEEVEARGLTATIPERVEKARKTGAPDHDACAVVLGKTDDGAILYDDGKMHVMVFAPTRAGKGVSVVIPTLLTWRGSCVVFDIKGENFQNTAAWRLIFSHVVFFSPTSMASARWNPLLEIRPGERAISDAMNVAEIMGESDDGENVYFTTGAKRILSAIFLYVLFCHPDKHMGTCVGLAERIDDALELMANATIPDPHVQRFVRDAAVACISADPKARGSWAAGAQIALYLWKDPIIVDRTSASDFFLRDLQYAADPVSVYLVIPPNDIDRLAPIVRLFTTMMTAVLCESLDEEGAHERHRLLMLCDEMPAFGRMDQVEKAIGFTAGYGIRWVFIGQGLDQYARIYSKDHSFLSSSHTRVAFRPNDETNARTIAGLIGKTTGLKEQEGESGRKGLLASLRNRSVSHVQFERDLLTPGEIQTLDGSRLIVLQAGELPILAHKVTYYDDPHFVPRVKNKRMPLPTRPLDDFPTPSVASRWGVRARTQDQRAHTSPTEQRLGVNEESWRAQEQRTGEDAAYVVAQSMAAGKAKAHEVDAITEATAGMSALESAVYLSTRSITADAVRVAIERAVRAGKLPAQMLADFDRVKGTGGGEPAHPPATHDAPGRADARGDDGAASSSASPSERGPADVVELADEPPHEPVPMERPVIPDDLLYDADLFEQAPAPVSAFEMPSFADVEDGQSHHVYEEE
jgi:type IV secretion system protein VirD4